VFSQWFFQEIRFLNQKQCIPIVISSKILPWLPPNFDYYTHVFNRGGKGVRNPIDALAVTDPSQV